MFFIEKWETETTQLNRPCLSPAYTDSVMGTWTFSDAMLNRRRASTPVPGTTAMTGYLYDAEGTRVAKGSISAWSCDPAVNGFQTTSDYILGPGGEQVTEMGVQAQQGSAPPQVAWQHTNVWAAGAAGDLRQDRSACTSISMTLWAPAARRPTMRE